MDDAWILFASWLIIIWNDFPSDGLHIENEKLLEHKPAKVPDDEWWDSDYKCLEEEKLYWFLELLKIWIHLILSLWILFPYKLLSYASI